MSIRDASSMVLPDGWKNHHGVPTCGQCLASVHNIRRHIHKLEEILARKSSFMPSLEIMTSHLAHLFREAMNKHDNCDLALAHVENKQDALDCITILSRRKAMDIQVTTNICTYRLFECHAVDCTQLVVKKFRANNDLLCRSCKDAKTNAVQSQRRRDARGNKAFALNSKTNLRHLDSAQLSERGKLFYYERKQ